MNQVPSPSAQEPYKPAVSFEPQESSVTSIADDSEASPIPPVVPAEARGEIPAIEAIPVPKPPEVPRPVEVGVTSISDDAEGTIEAPRNAVSEGVEHVVDLTDEVEPDDRVPEDADALTHDADSAERTFNSEYVAAQEKITGLV